MFLGIIPPYMHAVEMMYFFDNPYLCSTFMKYYPNCDIRTYATMLQNL